MTIKFHRASSDSFDDAGSRGQVPVKSSVRDESCLRILQFMIVHVKWLVLNILFFNPYIHTGKYRRTMHVIHNLYQTKFILYKMYSYLTNKYNINI